ncbi:MAG: uroporphyrinogen-III synthase [Sideroxydans sp.]|nr:uroporphyrinogen-III synthase [Sideroxydans sp.]
MKVNLPLANLNIVITRPRDQAAGLVQRIEQQGGTPLLFPLLEISPVADQKTLREQLSRIAQFDLAIFISPNAVQYGMGVIGKLPDNVRVAAVGQSSAQALRDFGVQEIIAPTDRSDSEALLDLLHNISGWRVAILRGDGGRELLGDTLKSRGARVEYITCYRRGKAPVDVAVLLAARADALAVTSSEALDHLWQMLGEQGRTGLAGTPLFVPHARIAELAQQQGWQNVIVSAAGDDGMLAALIAWAQTRRD